MRSRRTAPHRPLGILEDLQDANPVDHQIFFRVVNRVLVRKMGSKVVDNIGFFLKRPLQDSPR